MCHLNVVQNEGLPSITVNFNGLLILAMYSVYIIYINRIRLLQMDQVEYTAGTSDEVRACAN